MPDKIIETAFNFWCLILIFEFIWRAIVIIRFTYVFFNLNQSIAGFRIKFGMALLWPTKATVKNFDDNIQGTLKRYNFLVTVHYILLSLLFGLVIFGIVSQANDSH